MKRRFLLGISLSAFLFAASCSSKNEDAVSIDVHKNSNGDTELVIEETRDGVVSKSTYTGSDAERKLKELAADSNEKIREAAEKSEVLYKETVAKAQEELDKAAEKAKEEWRKAGEAAKELGEGADNEVDKAERAVEEAVKEVKGEIKKSLD